MRKAENLKLFKIFVIAVLLFSLSFDSCLFVINSKDRNYIWGAAFFSAIAASGIVLGIVLNNNDEQGKKNSDHKASISRNEKLIKDLEIKLSVLEKELFCSDSFKKIATELIKPILLDELNRRFDLLRNPSFN